MVDGVRKTVTPLLHIASLFGLDVFEYPRGRQWPYLTAFYCIILWLAYTYIIGWLFVKSYPTDIFNELSFVYVMFSSFCSMMVSIFFGFRNRQRIRQCLTRLDMVDETLQDLGSPNDYTEIRGTIKLLLFFWIFTYSTTCTVDYLICSAVFRDKSYIYLALTYDFFPFANTLVELLFLVIVKYIESRFEVVNEVIRDVMRNVGRGKPRQVWRTPTFKSFKIRGAGNYDKCDAILWITMHLHLELYKVARETNNIFEVQMIFQTITYFILLMGVVFELYMLFTHRKTDRFVESVYFFAGNSLWIIVTVLKLLILNITCESVCTKAKEAGVVVLKLSNSVQDDRLHEQVKQFVLQMMQKPLKFSGQGYFDFGYSNVERFISSITMFLVILLQMY